MKSNKVILILFILLSGFTVQAVAMLPDSTQTSAEISLKSRLEALDGVELISRKIDTAVFKEGFTLFISQPIDHDNPAKGSFRQKVYLSHRDVSSPMVIELDGYSVPKPRRPSELTRYLKANYMIVEHRYFGESKPDTMIWNCLNIRQAAADHHRIIELLRQVYPDKWVSTGISKGGQTTLYHRRYYPDDVDVAVPYVAPLNREVNDPRIYDFLDNIATDECHKKLIDFQRALLKKRKKIFPLFEEINKKKAYHFSQELGKIYELAILEFEFSFWQWGGNCDKIPDAKSKPEVLFRFFEGYDPESFFETSIVAKTFPFFYQAYTEVGLYGYRIEAYKDLLQYFDKDVDNYEQFIPDGFDLSYNPSTLLDIMSWLDENGNNIVYIYGELDAWSSTAYKPTEKTNAVWIMKEGGSHVARIRNLPDEQRKKVLAALEEWLDVKIYE